MNSILLSIVCIASCFSFTQFSPPQVNDKIHLSKQGTEDILMRIRQAQSYDDYVKIKSVNNVVEIKTLNEQLDTLVLYIAETRFYADKWKPIKYIRLCFLSDTYEFYQTLKDKGTNNYSIGKVDLSMNTIEILKNGEPYKTVSETHYSIME